MCRTQASPSDTAWRKTSRCVAGEHRPSLILRRSRTGKSVSVREFSISRQPQKLRGHALRFTKVGEHGSNAHWQISFSTCTPERTATKRFFPPSFLLTPQCLPPANCQNL